MTDKKKYSDMKAIRWDETDWEMVGKLAAKTGMTRTDFVKRATLAAAAEVLAGGVPYFVKGPQATTQNTRINNSGPLSEAKGDGIVGAGDRRRRRGVAKGADDAAKKKRGPEV